MDELKNALPAEGSLACAQKRKLPEESMARYRRNLLLTLGFCLLLADALSWSWGMGNTVTVFAWYLLLALAVGREELFRRRESRVLLGVNLALASTFALTSNPLFRWWNFLALAALVPLHAVSGLGSRPWWDPRMLLERCGLFFQGLFGNLWACFAAAVPEGRKTEKRDGRTMTVVLGLCGAVALVSFLIPVLVSADALFAASLERLNWNFQFRMFHFGDLFQRLFWALAFTPFVFSLLYAMAHPKRLCPAEEKKGLRVDALGFVLALASVDGLYLAFRRAGVRGEPGGQLRRMGPERLFPDGGRDGAEPEPDAGVPVPLPAGGAGLEGPAAAVRGAGGGELDPAGLGGLENDAVRLRLRPELQALYDLLGHDYDGPVSSGGAVEGPEAGLSVLQVGLSRGPGGVAGYQLRAGGLSGGEKPSRPLFEWGESGGERTVPSVRLVLRYHFSAGAAGRGEIGFRLYRRSALEAGRNPGGGPAGQMPGGAMGLRRLAKLVPVGLPGGRGDSAMTAGLPDRKGGELREGPIRGPSRFE